MKKYFYSVIAAAGMLFATSCSNDELTQVESGEYADVSISLGVEEVAGSRAISDGTGADELYYAVFNSTGQRISTIAQVHKTGVKFPTTETITLAKGQTYKVAFWAQDDDCNAYTVSDDMNVTVDYTGANNDETRDAFFKTVQFTVNGSTSLDVELKRPFAQINVGVEATDWNDAVASGIEIKESNVTIENAANSINLVTGKVNGSVKVDYTTAAIPAEPLKANNSTYNWLSMSYILVNDASETGDTETTLKSLKYTFSPESGKGNPITFSEGLNNVPVRRNWRTNILGKILTGDIQFNISIDPIYDGDIIYPSEQEQELEFAASFGGTVTLTEDVKLNESLVVGADMVLNLNGHTISGNWNKSEGAVIKNSANLKIVGGTVKSEGNNGGSAVQNNGTMTIENVTLNGAPNADDSWPAYTVNNTGELTISNSNITSVHGAVASYGADALITMNNTNIEMTGISGFTSHGIYTYNDGKVIVNGGTIANNATDQNSTGGSVINGNVEVTAGNFTGRIENYYGTPVLKGGTYSVNPNSKFIADGYKAIQNGDKWYVVADEVDAVATTTKELQEALNGGGNVVLANDVTTAKSDAGSNAYGATGINQTNGGTIDGNGNSYGVNAWGTWDSAISTTGGTIKNITINKGMRGIFVNHNSSNSGKVYLENVVIDGTVYTISCDQGTNQGLEATNSTFNGWTSYAGTIGDVKFVNCKFGKGQGYAYCRPYAPTTFVGCEFEAGYEMDPRAAVTFENCTLGGVALTADNLATLVTSNIANATVK